MRSNGGFTVGVHGTLQHMLALFMGPTVSDVLYASENMQQEKVREKCQNRAQAQKETHLTSQTGPVYKPFPFGLGKLDEESKTSLNVPFEWAFTPIRKCKKIKHANILEKIIRS